MSSLLYAVFIGSRCRLATAWGPTGVTEALNDKIRASYGCVYCEDGGGGKGIMVRNPLDGYEEAWRGYKVVPATFWHNDIFAASGLYVTAVADNVDCPNDGSNGFWDGLSVCPEDPNAPGVTGGWDYTAMAYAIGDHMYELMYDYDNIQSADWGWGVFYGTDSNSVDIRCLRYDDYSGFDCPGGWLPDNDYFFPDDTHTGSGGYQPGNPYAGFGGGGSGCHVFASEVDANGVVLASFIDQVDAWDQYGANIVSDASCQCNYDMQWPEDGPYSGWAYWVTTWIEGSVGKPDSYETWLGGNGKAPSKAVDSSACWVNNPRDMINIQNQIWWRREEWNNQLAPKSSWSKDSQSQHVYWGWNEVPIGTDTAANKALRDAVFIKLPGAVCGGTGVDDTQACLTDAAQLNLERDIQKWVDEFHLQPGFDQMGQQPGSDLVFVREKVDDSDNWSREFFCEGWWSPNGVWQVTYVDQYTDPFGCCYLDYYGADASTWCPSVR